MSTEGVNGAFSATPSIERAAGVSVADAPPSSAAAIGVPVASAGDVPAAIGLDRARLEAAGFDGAIGSTYAVATDDATVIAVGVGDAPNLDAAALRNAAAAFARAARSHESLAFSLDGTAAVDPVAAGQAVVEGVLLARYSYEPLRRAAKGTPVRDLTVVGDAAAGPGVERGRALAAVGALARDLANTPHSHLNATSLATIATGLGADRRLEVEIFDKDALVELGCGGLLGVNQGSAQPPCMIKLRYTPASGPAGATLTFVGKGIMYDSGGIALKPGDEVHAQMKNDMSGAAAVLAAMAHLSDLDCPNEVIGYLMCTDNMPSGTAMALGDVITMRGGTTVEVINTDAEGRLVMADALVLATEEPTDAIVDIATLTGACMRALGTQVAGVMGNNQPLVDQIRSAADATDEPVWQLPLEQRYRKELDSSIADLRNLGGANAGAITAALFLAEFVGDAPWAHIDIAGTAQSTGDAGWQTAGCTGFGARLLAELAVRFSAPAA
ncbi:MAG TPA: leucyl aminopeptidase [Ilumatobacteraceae bacterium]